MSAFVYVRIKQAIGHNMNSLSKADGDIAYTAWLARNLLELKVWVAYCATSRQRAEEFFDDALRDMIEMNSKFSTESATTNAAKGAVDPFKPPHKFKRVSDAASDVGMKDLFDYHNKQLSKFAHPTALSVMTRQVALVSVAKEVAMQAESLAAEALTELESSHMADLFRTCPPKMQEEMENLTDLT